MSKEGRLACSQAYPSVAFTSRQDKRQELYQTCLKSIDQKIKADKKILEDKAKQLRVDEASKAALQKQSAPSQASRLFYCRVHQNEIINAERERFRLLAGRIRAYRDENLTEAEKDRLISDYNLAENKLEQLIPPEYRQGQQLIPTAVDIFSRCDLSDFNH